MVFFFISFLAHLSMLRMSFWDRVMPVVRRTCGRPRRPIRPSINFLLVYTLDGTVLIGCI